VHFSVVIITFNEEANLARTLASVQPLVADGKGEIIVVDSGSTDRTVDIAKSFGAKVFVEEWKGFPAQKNSAIDKAQGKWILSLDADEEIETALLDELSFLFKGPTITDDSSTGEPRLFPRRHDRILRFAKEPVSWPMDQAWRLLARS